MSSSVSAKTGYTDTKSSTLPDSQTETVFLKASLMTLNVLNREVY